MNQLLIHDVAIHLEPLQSRLLVLLIEHRAQVVSLEDIVQKVWQRSHVSDNLVRQVISALRGHLDDNARPYRIIKTIPKQGYLLDIEVTQSKISKPNLGAKINQYWRWGAGVALIGCSVLSGIHYFSHSAPSQRINEVTKLVIHPFTLESEQDSDLSDSIENYLFYGLNSKGIDVYRHRLNSDADQLRGSLTEQGNSYKLTLFLDEGEGQAVKLEKTFTLDDYFTAIGDLATELKTEINHDDWQYQPSNHQVTSVNNLDDWHVISEGIESLYSGSDELDSITAELDEIHQQGRDNYLVDALLSYSSSVEYLKHQDESTKAEALMFAKEAFEQDPRCDISNLSLGLALIINQQYDQAYPYLSYAVETAPSALGYYLLYKVDQKTKNNKGADYYHKRFQSMASKPLDGLFVLSALK